MLRVATLGRMTLNLTLNKMMFGKRTISGDTLDTAKRRKMTLSETAFVRMTLLHMRM
jgi:hypothetical protein